MRPLGQPEASTDAFKQGLEVLRHFRSQVEALGDPRTLDLLSSVGPEPFTNGDAREALSMKRQASWKRLARLSEVGLLQKRGHSYRVAPFTSRQLTAFPHLPRS